MNDLPAPAPLVLQPLIPDDPSMVAPKLNQFMDTEDHTTLSLQVPTPPAAVHIQKAKTASPARRPHPPSSAPTQEPPSANTLSVGYIIQESNEALYDRIMDRFSSLHEDVISLRTLISDLSIINQTQGMEI